MDASFHADHVTAARRALEGSGLPLKPLGSPEVTKAVFYLPRFARIYTDGPEEGYPYLKASEAFRFRLQAERWVARKKAPAGVPGGFVKPGWTLVYRSGVNVGRCVIATRRMGSFFVTDDLIRVVPVLPAGYLYAFLASSLGNTLMRAREYGGAVPHLEPHHLATLPVPLAPRVEREAIHQQVMAACRLRDSGNDLLDEADALLHEKLELARFDQACVPYLGDPGQPRAFTVRASQLRDRLDATYHLPVAKAAVAQLRTGRQAIATLGSMAQRVFVAPRFKRIYVDPAYGTPLLQGSHVPLIKPYDLRCISLCATPNIERWTVRRGWVLVTCSGTVGRVSLVTSRQDGWAASQHILRIVPREGTSHPGFLAAFLMTPFGQHQLAAMVYGAVVDELTAEDTEQLILPAPPYAEQEAVGELVIRAFEMRDEANQLEAHAVERLERAVCSAHPEATARNLVASGRRLC